MIAAMRRDRLIGIGTVSSELAKEIWIALCKQRPSLDPVFVPSAVSFLLRVFTTQLNDYTSFKLELEVIKEWCR